MREFLEIGSELSMQHCLWRKTYTPNACACLGADVNLAEGFGAFGSSPDAM